MLDVWEQFKLLTRSLSLSLSKLAEACVAMLKAANGMPKAHRQNEARRRERTTRPGTKGTPETKVPWGRAP